MANEKRLIDAKAYCMELYDEMNYPGRSEEFMAAIDVAIADLADAPTVDAVKVVRCEKCVLHGNCITEDTFVLAGIENPFCCAGKRKEGAD